MSARPGPHLASMAGLAGLCLQVAAAPPPYAPPMESFVTNRPRLFLNAAARTPEPPRLFINAAAAPAVTQVAARLQLELLDGIRKHVDALAAATNLPAGDYGVESAAAALLFLRERTPERLNVAKELLQGSVDHYRSCDRENRVVSHYSATRIHAITAYDWLYDALSPEARDRIGRDLLAHVAYRVLDRRVSGDNLSDYRSGFYGEISLPWYVGIATRGTGIDEEKSAAAIAFGYDQQMRMLEHRRRLSGDDGGGATATLGYALRADPGAEFHFFHTMYSAFRTNIAPNWPYLALLPNYVLWNRLPGGLEFGSGDAFHTSNELPDEHLFSHLAQIRHFFGASHPEQAALAAWLQPRCRRPAFSVAEPLTPFFLTPLAAEPPPRGPPPNLPLARHFTGLGQIFMRSGWGDDDTYALYTAGGLCDRHKHFDENTFAIYRQGFLALDTGTRPMPGSHLFQYYCRTVAHNGVLIRMDDEQMPKYWGTPAPGEPVLPAANDGGMRSPTGAVIRAFRTTPDFTYIASDATACYHPAKCRLALRQFVHIQPDSFVVFDRVETGKPEQRPVWLLHTAEEPRVAADRFSASHQGGRLWCRTLLPSNAVLTKVGGPGREFWSDGRNWPLPVPAELGGETIKRPELLGAWRMEVSPAESATEVLFLHLIEVGDVVTKTNMPPARYLSERNWTGVELQQGERTVRVQFRTRGEVSCEIRIEGAGKHLAATLDNTVQAQSEWETPGP